MPNWLFKRPDPHRTTLAMIGAKPGNRLLVAGAREPDLAAALALVTGLNGQTLVIDDRAEAIAQVESAAARAGALVDLQHASIAAAALDPDAFDVAVALVPLAPLSPADRQSVVSALLAALKPGGRLIVIDGAAPRGLFGSFSSGPPTLPSDDVLGLLRTGGCRVYRQLGSADRVSYYEGLKSRD